jgi:metallo-beta-lactamase superfamily protein
VPSQKHTAELSQLTPGLWIWHEYDPSVKADLFATAFAATARLYLADPIPLAEPEFRELTEAGTIHGVIVTNANHQRAASDYAERLSVPVFANRNALDEINAANKLDALTLHSDENLQIIEIEGAVGGEIAIYLPAEGGTVIIGDALINFEPYGFTFLPRKYCLDQKQMRCSLRKLLSLSFKRMLFAHGTPIVSEASRRLEQLLETGS